MELHLQLPSALLGPAGREDRTVLLQRDINARIAAVVAACDDPVVIAAVAAAEESGEP